MPGRETNRERVLPPWSSHPLGQASSRGDMKVPPIFLCAKENKQEMKWGKGCHKNQCPGEPLTRR